MTESHLSPTSTLVDAIRAIESSRRRIAVVLGAGQRLLGTLTDGDVRRALLAERKLDAPVGEAMNKNPITASDNSPPGYLLDLMRKWNILAIPLLDDRQRFKRLVHISELDQERSERGDASEFAFAVIMAGGEGMRLRPLTENIPKPMLPVGGVPLLERQIQHLAQSGVRRIYIAVNYLGHVIEDHFGDGASFNVEIRYLREEEKRGTAGALFLLPEQPEKPILLINGDIVTTSDFGSLYNFHQNNAACLTVAAIDHRINIPYGVIRAEGSYLSELVEKPSQRFLCNAGIYAISPESLELVQNSKHCNMTDIIEACLTNQMPVAVFPLHEYWSDVGTLQDLEKTQKFFNMVREDA